jgi:hypothetical protein
MWRLLRMFRRTRDGNANQRNRGQTGISPISAANLASIFGRAPDSLIIFDLCESAEINAYPSTIPGALFTTNVSLGALVPWIPPKTIVVVYATADIPDRYALVHFLSKEMKLYALEGGLLSWQKADSPMEQLTLSDRKSVDNR